MGQINRLSKREWEVVDLLLQGKSNKLIAMALGISDRTVEFHLKNVYAKLEVRSRVELILKLANATGAAQSKKLGSSTVARPDENADNRDAHGPPADHVPSFRGTVSFIGEELQMKSLVGDKHVQMGAFTALCAGFFGVAVFSHFAHMLPDEVMPWVIPLAFVLVLIGASIGMLGKRNGNTRLKVFFSTLVGTGLGPLAIVPVLLFVVLPLGKLVERLGLIDRATMPADVASVLVLTTALVIWLFVGAAIGIMLLFVTVKRNQRVDVPNRATGRSL